MGTVVFTDGFGVPHRRFEDEFLTHRNCSEWWYCTGYLTAEHGREFSFQYSLARVRILGVRFHMMLTAVTDLDNRKHYYGQQIALFRRGVTTNLDETTFRDVASVTYSPNEHGRFGDMRLSMRGTSYDLQLHMQAQKAPVWHCENGRLRMGLPDDPRQITYYFSFTNLKATGTLVLNSKKHAVTGKVWFDKQGGPYSLTRPETNWEWFSFRFFDNEEIMLFSFPQNGYRDGTYIDADGKYRRLDSYQIEPLGFVTEPRTGYRFSDGWKVSIPGVKDQEYLVHPKVEGQFNVSFYELLADVLASDGRIVGHCVVELLPGARNKKINSMLAFKRQR
jgi:predicted secreted hydrolase